MSAPGRGWARGRVPIVSLLAANAISMTGNNAALVAIPWFVLATTGSATRTGITAFAGLVPIVLSGLFGGALIDRIGYRRMSIVADIASGVATAAIPLMHATVGLGVLLAGPAIVMLGLRGTFLVVGGIYFAVTLAVTFLRPLRGLDDQPPATAGRIDTVSPSDISVSSDPK